MENRIVRVAVDETTNIEPQVKEGLRISTLPIHITGLTQEMELAANQLGEAEFYQLLGKSGSRLNFGTKAGGFFEIRRILEAMIQTDDCDIICFVVGGELSAIYDNTVQAAMELMRIYPNRIAVIGGQAFLSLEIIAETAAEFALMGKSFEEVLNFVKERRPKSFVWGSVIDLRRLRSSGRVPIPMVVTGLVQPVLKVFHLLPSFILEGEKPRIMKLFRRENLVKFVARLIQERVGFRERLVVKISYTGIKPPEEAELLYDFFNMQDEFILIKPVQLVRASPVIGVHTGTGLVAIGVVGMGYEHIATPVLIKFFIEAQRELKRLRAIVNSINVFPVRDGDTGSNLLSPLLGITEGVDATMPISVVLNQLVTLIARRGGGYSGGALSAFFLGFNTTVQQQKESDVLHLETLVWGLKWGTDRCYQYFGTAAKEGTILSVMRAAEQAARRAFNDNPTFSNVIIQMYLGATEELLNPQVQEVEILRQERLVDAGGFGFTLLLWALLRTLGLHREARVWERYHLVLREVRGRVELGQRLIYRRQPEALRGFCIEGCVRGEVAIELHNEFLKLDNRLADAKMTFNEVDGTTHFHIHVSEGLEEQVQRIANRFGYILPPRPPTRLSKRRREIYRFRLVNIFIPFKKILRRIFSFSLNWLAYALFFPIAWTLQYQRWQKSRNEVHKLRLIQRAFIMLTNNSKWQYLIFDSLANVVFSSGSESSGGKMKLESLFPPDVLQQLRINLAMVSSERQVGKRFCYKNYQFEILLITTAETKGYLLKYRRLNNG